MTEIELEIPCAEVSKAYYGNIRFLQETLLTENTLRVLPSLAVFKVEIDQFVNAMKTEFNG